MRRSRRGRWMGDSSWSTAGEAGANGSHRAASASTQGELVLMNGSRFTGSICSRSGPCAAEFLTCDGEVLQGKWLFRCLFYDTAHASPIAAYSVKLYVDSSRRMPSRSCSPTKDHMSPLHLDFKLSPSFQSRPLKGSAKDAVGTRIYRGEALLVLKSGDLLLTQEPALLASGRRMEAAEAERAGRMKNRDSDGDPRPEGGKTRLAIYRTASITRDSSDDSLGNYAGRTFGLSEEEDGRLSTSAALISPVRSRVEKQEAQRDSSMLFWSLFGQSTVRSRWDDEIQKDVARTSFALWPKGRTRTNAHDQLYDILRFIAQAFPQIGYCQGMHCVAKYLMTFYGTEDDSSIGRILWRSGSSGSNSGSLLSSLDLDLDLDLDPDPDEQFPSAGHTASTFILFAELLKSPDYRLADLFSPGFALLKSLLSELDCRLEKVEPVLFAHLEETHVHSLLYATKWFLTVFTFYVELDRDAVTNVWLRFLSQGWDSVIDIAVACVSGVKELLLNADLDACLEVLSGRSAYTKDGLLANVFATQRGHACLLQASKYAKGAEFYRQPSPLPFTQSNAKPARFARRHSFS